MHLPESDTIETFKASLDHIKAWEDSFDVIYPGHESSPLSKERLEELIKGVVGIMKGEIKGTMLKAFGYKGLRYKFGQSNWVICKVI